MSQFRYRRTLSMLLCSGCVAASQVEVFAQTEKERSVQHAFGWKPVQPQKGISLPEVRTVSEQTPSQVAGQPPQVVPNPFSTRQTTQVELGLPTAAPNFRYDPIPTSPWSDDRSAAVQSSPASGYPPRPETQMRPTSSGAMGPTALSRAGTLGNAGNYQPKFIEQPVAPNSRSTSPSQGIELGRPTSAPSLNNPTRESNVPPNDSLDFNINAPLSNYSPQPTQFRTASNAQQVIESPAQVPTSTAASPATPNFQDWNTIRPQGIVLADDVQSPRVASVPQQVQPAETQSSNTISASPVSNVQAITPSRTALPMPAEQSATTSALDAQAKRFAEDTARRESIAARVSEQLLSNPVKKGTVTRPLENPRGWTAIEEDLKLHLQKCDDLLRRGAIQSAREEVLQGLRGLCRALDCRENDWYAEPALDRAMTAFEEERDFYNLRSTSVPNDSMVAGHQTPVFKNQSTRELSPAVAAQHYRAFARQELIAASMGHPWAADLYYALGKTLEAQAEQGDELAPMCREQAITCYQAALAIRRTHGEAANQLGYSLLKVDRSTEAETALMTAVAASPTPQAWKNLAEVYRRSGDLNRADYAVQQATALEQNKPVMSNGKPMPEVVELSPEQFAQMSPNMLQPNSPPAWNQPPPYQNNLANSATLPQTLPMQTASTPVNPAAAPVAKTSKLDAIKNFFR